MWSIQNWKSTLVMTSLNYNILNIVVNTEPNVASYRNTGYYNILNIVVNTEHKADNVTHNSDYNILNIVVNTERRI